MPSPRASRRPFWLRWPASPSRSPRCLATTTWPRASRTSRRRCRSSSTSSSRAWPSATARAEPGSPFTSDAMAAETKNDNEPYDDINITPMLDLAYVLLVTFIILTTASVQGVRVRAPETQAQNNLSRPQTRAITITADGSLYLDAYPVTLEQLKASLSQYRAAN